MAGRDGIQNKIDPGEAMDKDLYDLPPEELADIPTVCASLREAMDELEADMDFLTAGGVFTKDLDRATSAARQIKAGQVFVNEWFAGGVETPFGGYGKSGYGREKGREALWNYVQTKNIAVRLG